MQSKPFNLLGCLGNRFWVFYQNNKDVLGNRLDLLLDLNKITGLGKLFFYFLFDKQIARSQNNSYNRSHGNICHDWERSNIK